MCNRKGVKMSGKFIKGAFLLTAAALVSKILSAGYRIPLQNVTGDFGFYIYQQVYPILGIVLILSLYGLPSAISRMVVDLQEKGFSLSWKSFYFPVLLIIGSMLGLFFVVLYAFSPFIATMAGDRSLIPLYQTAAIAFLFVPLLAVLRGVFQGYGEMKYTAYSQMVEQTIRVSFIVIVALFVTYKGMELYYIGVGAAIASILGAIGATCMIMFPFLRQKRYAKVTYPIPWGYYLRTIVVLGVVASMNHMTLLLLQLVDAVTLVPQLMAYGLTSVEAMLDKGVLDRGQPLIQLGTVLGSSFALASIPIISSRKMKEHPHRVYHQIQTAFLYSFYLAAGATVGLIILFPETNILLYENAKGTASLRLLVSTMFFSALVVTGAAILQGLGYFKKTALFLFIVILTKVLLNYILVPQFGISGSALATVSSMVLLFMLVYFELKRRFVYLTVFRHIQWATFFKAIFSMVFYLYLMKYIGSTYLEMSRLALLYYVVFMVISGGGLYLLLLLRGKVFTESELSVLPFASVFIRLHKGRD